MGKHVEKKITFIIPVYNIPVKKLDVCISSIERQGIPNYEIIVIDDGSNKEYELETISALHEDVKYYRQKNSGVSKARNLGLEYATGENIIFIDADDEVPENFYQKARNVLQEKFDILLFSYCLVEPKNKRIIRMPKNVNLSEEKQEILANIMFYPGKLGNYMFGSVWAKCFSKPFLDNNKIVFENNLRKAEDRRFMVDAIMSARTIKYSPVCAYCYNININSISHKLNWNMEEYYFLLKKSFDSFCTKNAISREVSKFLEYSIFWELILLTVCHMNAGLKYSKRRKKFFDMYKNFNIDYKIRQINYRDFATRNEKAKLFLMKRKWFLCILLIAYRKQHFENKGKTFYTKR
ncbi:glycosyltransferase [Candidatus Saccharibacteria bacterium]|nr:glycosyltransferase [Candidatus Saccharibacteria bacterium]